MSTSVSVTGVMTAMDPMSFAVEVRDDDSTTEHMVTLVRGDYERLSRQGEEPEAFVERCFEFLLEREDKGSILRTFDVGLISRYFPEFESVIGG